MGNICLQKHNLHPVTMTDLISFHKKRAAVDTTITIACVPHSSNLLVPYGKLE